MNRKDCFALCAVTLIVSLLSIYMSFASLVMSYRASVFVSEEFLCEEYEVEEVEEVEVVDCAEEIIYTEKVVESLGIFKLTAYCSCEKCCGKWGENRPVDENGDEIVFGASGERLVEGVSVAVDPSVIPYGSVLEIDGCKYKAQDCGGAIKNNRIDVYFDDHQSAVEFGVREAEVFLLEV